MSVFVGVCFGVFVGCGSDDSPSAEDSTYDTGSPTFSITTATSSGTGGSTGSLGSSTGSTGDTTGGGTTGSGSTSSSAGTSSTTGFDPFESSGTSGGELEDSSSDDGTTGGEATTVDADTNDPTATTGVMMPPVELPNTLPPCVTPEDCPNEGDVCGAHGYCASPCETFANCIRGLSCVAAGYCVPVCEPDNPCPPRCPPGCVGNCPEGCPENCQGLQCPEELGMCLHAEDPVLGNGDVCHSAEAVPPV